jgi:hypothetical protein
MSIDFEQFASHFKAAIEIFAILAHFALAIIRCMDPVCAGYTVVAAVLLWRAWHFHKAGKPEHSTDCAIHGVLAAFIAVMHGL